MLGLAACAPALPRTVPRVVDGKVERGSFVSPYAYEWFVEGEMLATEGLHDEAAVAFENATAAPSTDPLLMTRLAEEYELSGAARRADRVLMLANRHHPRSARVALSEGRIQQHRDAHEDALSSFARARRLAPDWDAPVIAMAEALEARGNPARASALLLEYVENAGHGKRTPALSALVSLAQRQNDVETLERALGFDPAISREARIRATAELALDAGKPSLAARILKEVRDDPDTTSLWVRALVESGARKQAAAFLASPGGARFGDAAERAAMLIMLDEPDRALDLLSSARRTARSQYSRGRALAADGRYVEAVGVLAAVPRGSSSYESALLALADCSLAQRRTGAAAEIVSVAPHGSLAVRMKLAEAYLREDELRPALRLFDPKRAADRTALASLFERGGHFEEAAAYYASVHARPTNDPRVRARATAEQLASRGLRRAAIDVLERWTASAPDDLYARVRLVELLQAEDRTEAAETRGRQTMEVVVDPLLRDRLAELLTQTGAAALP